MRCPRRRKQLSACWPGIKSMPTASAACCAAAWQYDATAAHTTTLRECERVRPTWRASCEPGLTPVDVHDGGAFTAVQVGLREDRDPLAVKLSTRYDTQHVARSPYVHHSCTMNACPAVSPSNSTMTRWSWKKSSSDTFKILFCLL